MEIHNVIDRRRGWIGAFEAEPLNVSNLTEADVGSEVVYRPADGRSEVGVLTSWRDGVVFARYSTGDTAAAAKPEHLFLVIRRIGHWCRTARGLYP